MSLVSRPKTNYDSSVRNLLGSQCDSFCDLRTSGPTPNEAYLYSKFHWTADNLNEMPLLN